MAHKAPWHDGGALAPFLHATPVLRPAVLTGSRSEEAASLVPAVPPFPQRISTIRLAQSILHPARSLVCPLQNLSLSRTTAGMADFSS